MKTIRSIVEMQETSNRLRLEGKTIALVPTMGFFHEGHLSLMRKAADIADVVITSLFVNPKQFAPNEDYSSYPRDFERDEAAAAENGSDYLFYPNVIEMYQSRFSAEVKISGLTNNFEGLSRPTHFTGVATVVAKLFNCALPHKAVFGQKDFQQTLVVKQLARDLNFPIEIVVCKTVRESNGLAMSSRNFYLSDEERERAGVIFQTLEKARIAIETGERKRKIINAIMIKSLKSVDDIKIDYCSAVEADTLEEPDQFEPSINVALLIAVYVGKTRLIDNSVVTIPVKVL